MPDIQSIRTLHQRGYSERQIAKLLKLNRETVHRYIEMAVVPTQVRMEIEEPRPAVKFKAEWKKTVRDLLQAEAEKRVRRKQRLTARKVHEILVAKHSADISEVTVRRYVAELRAVSRELGMSDEALRLWVRQAEVEDGRREGMTEAEKEELRRLRRELRIAQEEREILKKQPPSSPRRAAGHGRGLPVRGGGEGEP